jgi:hypothetical protein
MAQIPLRSIVTIETRLLAIQTEVRSLQRALDDTPDSALFGDRADEFEPDLDALAEALGTAATAVDGAVRAWSGVVDRYDA